MKSLKKQELIMSRSTKETDEMNLFKMVQTKLRNAEREYLKARIHMEMFINKHPNKIDMWQHEVDRIYEATYGGQKNEEK
jgi:hypothetical protein|tara:strand:+ start:1691 stop:1930 length:240 start_codon:yes stop_codon:yes gene_type:complete